MMTLLFFYLPSITMLAGAAVWALGIRNSKPRKALMRTGQVLLFSGVIMFIIMAIVSTLNIANKF